MGLLDPGMDYYRAVSDGQGQALRMKANYDMARQAQDER